MQECCVSVPRAYRNGRWDSWPHLGLIRGRSTHCPPCTQHRSPHNTTPASVAQVMKKHPGWSDRERVNKRSAGDNFEKALSQAAAAAPRTPASSLLAQAPGSTCQEYSSSSIHLPTVPVMVPASKSTGGVWPLLWVMLDSSQSNLAADDHAEVAHGMHALVLHVLHGGPPCLHHHKTRPHLPLLTTHLSPISQRSSARAGLRLLRCKVPQR